MPAGLVRPFFTRAMDEFGRSAHTVAIRAAPKDRADASRGNQAILHSRPCVRIWRTRFQTFKLGSIQSAISDSADVKLGNWPFQLACESLSATTSAVAAP